MISSLLLFGGSHQLHFHIILWKQSHISLGWGSILVEKSCKHVYFFLLRNSTSHYLHSALLCRNELHCWGSWLSFDMASKVARICLNTGLSWITTQSAVTTVKPASAGRRADWTKRLGSLLALLPSSSSWVQQNWPDSRSGWSASERRPDKDKPPWLQWKAWKG